MIKFCSRNIMDWLHKNVTPWAAVALLVCAAAASDENDDDDAWSYLFAVLFVFLAIVWPVKLYRWLSPQHLQQQGKSSLWQRIQSLLAGIKESFVAKVCLGLIIVNLTAGSSLWLHYHFDLWAIVRLLFFLSHGYLVVGMLRQWIDATFLSYLVSFVRDTWLWEKQMIHTSPLAGMGVILAASALPLLGILVNQYWDKWFVHVATIASEATVTPTPQRSRVMQADDDDDGPKRNKKH
jgi:hypothetical protein